MSIKFGRKKPKDDEIWKENDSKQKKQLQLKELGPNLTD
jgi:hypothetical protein